MLDLILKAIGNGVISDSIELPKVDMPSSAADFVISAAYLSPRGMRIPLVGLFDTENLEPQAGHRDEAVMNVLAADLPRQIEDGDRVLITSGRFKGLSFKPVEMQQDGKGMAVLKLKLAAERSSDQR